MLPDMDDSKVPLIKNYPACRNSVVFVSSKLYALTASGPRNGSGWLPSESTTPEQFQSELTKALDDKIDLSFGGSGRCRPRFELTSIRRNTSCVSMEFARGQFLIFDAGSGIKQLSDRLAQRIEQISMRGSSFLTPTGPYQCAAFLRPLYQQGNEFEILVQATDLSSVN